MVDLSYVEHENQALVRRIALLEQELAEMKKQRQRFENHYLETGIGYQSLDSEGRLFSVNDAWLKLFEYERKDVIGRSLADFLPEEPKRQFLEFFPKSKALGEIFEESFEMLKQNGSPCIVSLSGWVERDAVGNYLRSHCIVQDITRQKELERKRESERKLLAICHQASDLESLMKNLTQFFKKISGCEAIGIRLKKDGDYPYYQTVGFPDTFIKLENSLCSRDENGSIIRDFTGNPSLDCMCGNIICGRFDTRLPFFTEFGSFWSNCTSQLLASTSAAERQSNTRNRCNGWGYESVALVPIKNQHFSHGLVQFNDQRPNRFTAERIKLFEHLVSYVALTLAKHLTDTELRASEQKYRTVVENAQEAIVVVQSEKIILANAATERMTGFPKEYLGACTFLQIFLPDDQEAILAHQKRILLGAKEQSSQFVRIVHKDNVTRWVENHTTLIEWNGKPASLNFLNDVTEKRLSEIARLEDEQNLQAILNASPESIQLFDLEGRTILANEATARRLKTTIEELKGKIVYDFFPPEIAAHRKKLIDQVIATGEPVLCRDTREGITFDSHLWPVLNQDGKVVRIAVFAIDSSDREVAAKKLEESHQLLKNLANLVPGVVYQYRLYPDGRSAFPYASPGMYSIYEVTPEEVREDATPVFGRLHPEDHDRVAADIFHSANTLETFYCEFRVILPMQGLRWRWSQAQPQRMNDGGTLWHGIISDITDRKIAEEKLRESNAYLENLINYANVPIIVWDMHFRVTRFNHAFEELSGRNAQEIVGKSLKILFPPSEAESSVNLIRQTTEGGRWKNIAINIQHANGEIRNLLWNSALIMGADNKTPAAVIAQGYDVSDQKKAEEEKKKLQSQLHQAQKMEAIGTLAGGIAHDFNNILGAILGYAEMVQEDSPAGSSMRKDIDQVVKASLRAKDLVKQILAFSRQAESDRIPLQPAIIIKEALKLLRASLPTTIAIQQDIDQEAGPLLADPTQIHQIIVNLCTNAFHAMEERGGVLTISLQNRILTAEDLIHEPQVSRRFVQLSIGDTGPGITPEIQKKIFDPYFTTKEVGKGTGMGLAIVHGIVRSYNGFITCLSTPGEGTVFHVLLPIIEEDQAGVLVETAHPDISQLGNERILFIDDEEILAEMGKTMLERLGYFVTVRRNSLEALDTFQSQPDQFDLVITDQTMPGMTGVDMARRMLQIRPGIPIILCTGYSSLISEEKAKYYGIKGFAMKPLSKKDIARLIREVLDGKRMNS